MASAAVEVLDQGHVGSEVDQKACSAGSLASLQARGFPVSWAAQGWGRFLGQCQAVSQDPSGCILSCSQTASIHLVAGVVPADTQAVVEFARFVAKGESDFAASGV